MTTPEPAEIEDSARCKVPMIHRDKTEERCARHADHVLQDTDHIDVHGCHAPVLVHQSTIDEARRLQDVPWPWEKED